jgi:hypothetical protein
MPLHRLAPLAVVLAVALGGARPASAAEVKPDPSTPKGAAAALFKAMQSGDAAAVRPLVVGTDRQVALFQAMVPLTGAFKALETAAVKKFGPEGKQITGGGSATTPAADLEDELEAAQEKIDGDTAELTPKATAAADAGKTAAAAKPPMKLKRVDGVWKVDLASMPTEKLDTPASITLVQKMTGLARDTATEIDDGKYKTVDEAKLAFQQKILPAILQAAAADQAGANTPPPPPAVEEKPKAPEPK